MMEPSKEFGAYRLLGPLGHGAMGTVFEAEQIYLRRKVALKILEIPPGDTDAMARCRREMHLVSGLSHPNLVAILDAGEVQGRAYIAMEMVHGPNLEGHLDPDTALPWRAAVSIARGIVAGVAYLHENGIIHRDIKLANVMLAAGNTPKILDFGLARRTDGTLVTQADMAVGTVTYMPPEVFAGQLPDASTDSWAVGCVLYRMLTGRLPFEFPLGSPLPLILKILSGHMDPVEQHVLGLPRDLAQFVGKLLSKDKRERPTMDRTAVELLEQMHRLPELKSAQSRGETRENPIDRSRLMEHLKERSGVLSAGERVTMKAGTHVPWAYVWLLGLLLGLIVMMLRPHAPDTAVERAGLMRLRSKLLDLASARNMDHARFRGLVVLVGFPDQIGLKKAMDEVSYFFKKYQGLHREVMEFAEEVEKLCPPAARTLPQRRLVAEVQAEQLVLALRIDVLDQLTRVIPRIIESGDDNLLGLQTSATLLDRVTFSDDLLSPLVRTLALQADVAEEYVRNPDEIFPNQLLMDIFRVGGEFVVFRFGQRSMKDMETAVEHMKARLAALTGPAGASLGRVATQCWLLGYGGSSPKTADVMGSLLRNVDELQKVLANTPAGGAAAGDRSLDRLVALIRAHRTWTKGAPR